jgi:hypothetical protein
MITLFSERPEQNQRPYTFLVSILVHGAAAGLVSLGILTAPKVKTPALAQRYEVRHLDLHTIKSEMERAASKAIEQARPQIKHKLPPPKMSAAVRPPAMRQMVQAPPGPQTLLQPDIPKPMTLTVEIPVPAVVIWDGQKTPAKTLVAPLPEKPAVANVPPLIEMPNQEQNVADIALAASDLVTKPQPILPSTTSPVVAPGPEPTPPAPLTTTEGAVQPTPTALMSASDLQMERGDVTLPPVNESAAANSSGALGAGQTKDSAPEGPASPTDKIGETGAGQSTPNAGETPDAAAATQGDETAPGQTGSSPTDSSQTGSSPIGSGKDNQPSAAHISLPHDGQFGAVVVGSSLEEKYPETAPLWSGRLSYTVYLHVGLARSWILQYSLSRADNAAAAGNITHIEAPWPYNIVRPNIEPGAIDADALMVHGFVNQAGRFEALSVLFPPQFAQAQFVLDALTQWQFRPATQNGQNVLVEVLLIIPDEPQ